MSHVSRCVTPASCFPIPILILAILELSVWHDYSPILLFSYSPILLFSYSPNLRIRPTHCCGKTGLLVTYWTDG